MSSNQNTTDTSEKARDEPEPEDTLSRRKDSYSTDNDYDVGEEVITIDNVKWVDKNPTEKSQVVTFLILKILGLICSLFFFICSLDLLSCGFRIIGGRSTGSTLQKIKILQNPIVGVMIGLLLTVAVQSSSTTTSILVGLVSSHIITVQVAIPFVMGANIGTSITNAIVSLGQIGDRHQFKLAFAGACVHDAFNCLTVIVLLTVEVLTGMLYKITGEIVKTIKRDGKSAKVEILSLLTKPIVNNVVKLVDPSQWKNLPNSKSIIKSSKIFPSSWSDGVVGSIVLAISLIFLFTCLMATVKILKSILQGQLAKIVKRTVNANVPHVPWLAGYIAILVGMFMTFLLQSSSVFTSAMTPLIGLGVISIDRAYPLTLGSNVGTCITAIIASLTVQVGFHEAFQIALCHLFFNVIGILIFYPIPFMRLPVGIAKFIGRETSKYRWFAIAYMLILFFILPLIVLALSLAGNEYVIAFAAIFAVICLFIAIVSILQKRKPTALPKVLRDWKWLPLGLRSLQPIDDFFDRFRICRIHTNKKDTDANISQSNAQAEGDVEQKFENHNELVEESGDQHDVNKAIETVTA